MIDFLLLLGLFKSRFSILRVVKPLIAATYGCFQSGFSSPSTLQWRCFASTATPSKKYPNRQVPYSSDVFHPIVLFSMQAINGVRNCAVSKFDETLEVTANLNIDPKKTNVIIRGLLSVCVHGSPNAIASSRNWKASSNLCFGGRKVCLRCPGSWCRPCGFG